jgi:hypothetical protein
MANVPYSGVPEAPAQINTPDDYQHIDARPEMFGALIGQGMQSLGAGASQAGEFFGQVQTDDALNGAMSTANKTLEQFKSLKGADALNAQASTQQAIDDAFKSARDGLATPKQQYQFDQTARFFQERYLAGQISTHANQQATVYASGVNRDQADLAANLIATNPNDPDQILHAKEDMRTAMVKQAQNMYGQNLAPEILKSTLQQADQRTYETQIKAVAANDPVRARQMLGDPDIKSIIASSPNYDSLNSYVTNRAAQSEGIGLGMQAVRHAAQPPQQPAPTVRNVSAAGSPVAAVVTDAAQQAGIDPSHALTVANIESGVGANLGTRGDIGQTGKGGDLPAQAENMVTALKQAAPLADAALGRPAQPWEQYVVYQQGAGGGPALLRAQATAPDAKAVDVLEPLYPSRASAIEAVTGNGGAVDMTTSQFLGHIEQTYQAKTLQAPGAGAGPTGPGEPQSLKSGAYGYILAKTAGGDDYSQLVQRHALTWVAQEDTAAQVAEAADAKARKQASDTAANGYLSHLMNGQYNANTIPQIANDPNLTWETKNHLWDIIQTHAKREAAGDSAKFGDGYYDALQKLILPNGDPNRISTLGQLLARGGANGDLTAEGITKLSGFMGGLARPEGAADLAMQKAAIDYGKHNLSFEADYGTFKLPDPKGEDAFKVGFLPAFYQTYQKGIDAGKTPSQLLSKDSPDFIVDKLIAAYKRTPAQEMRDRMNAGVEVSASGATPTIPKPVMPTVGEVRDGYVYKGGDPGLPQSWAPVDNKPSAPLAR